MDISHCIVYSHGFGVKKDDRGLFTDIAAHFPETKHVLFDYNSVDIERNEITVRPFSEQVAMLRATVSDAKDRYPNAEIDLVCHSQGSRIAALAQIQGIRHTVMLAPPVDGGAERTIKRYINNPACTINLDGQSRLARSDGSTTIIPAEYWAERMHERSPIEQFNELGEITQLTIIKAAQDHVTGDTSFDGLASYVSLMSIDGDHDFTQTRPLLLQTVTSILV